MNIPREGFRIRDPYILPYQGEYLLYASYPEGNGFAYFKSKDLSSFEGPFPCYEAKSGQGRNLFWAPEVHEYRGSYYLFASSERDSRYRGVLLAKSSSPYGPFEFLGFLTPDRQNCIDGTLFLENGKPHLIYVHEWVDLVDGEMLVLPLQEDLLPEEEPTLLFKASSAPWVGRISRGGLITDGPFLYQDKGGVSMLWSSFDQKQVYRVGRAHAPSLFGPWAQEEKPLYNLDGGHPSLFHRGDETWVAFHGPNEDQKERLFAFPYSKQDLNFY